MNRKDRDWDKNYLEWDKKDRDWDRNDRDKTGIGIGIERIRIRPGLV